MIKHVNEARRRKEFIKEVVCITITIALQFPGVHVRLHFDITIVCSIASACVHWMSSRDKTCWKGVLISNF